MLGERASFMRLVAASIICVSKRPDCKAEGPTEELGKHYDTHPLLFI